MSSPEDSAVPATKSATSKYCLTLHLYQLPPLHYFQDVNIQRGHTRYPPPWNARRPPSSSPTDGDEAPITEAGRQTAARTSHFNLWFPARGDPGGISTPHFAYLPRVACWKGPRLNDHLLARHRSFVAAHLRPDTLPGGGATRRWADLLSQVRYCWGWK